jgi:hypothetical protein
MGRTTNFDDVRVGSGPLASGTQKLRGTFPSIATTGATEILLIAPFAGVLSGAIFTSVSALATSDTNYITFAVVNRGNSDAAMLAASDANTTKATGGTALTARAKRSLALNGTAANLVVAAGDVISIIATATGTLAGAVAGGAVELTLTPS